MATLLGDEEIDYVGSSLEPTDDGVSGQLVLVTPTRYILATATDAATPDSFHPERGDRDSVDVRAWGRNTLIEASVMGGTDRRWHATGSADWPRGAQLLLRFRHANDLVLPLPTGSLGFGDDLSALLPGLMRDLVKH
jgi:hypothetical protein